MCEANVYLDEKEIIKDAISIKPVEGGLAITDILGKTTVVDAVIKEVQLLEHKVILVARDSGLGTRENG